jgi:glycosyltransferase involved in cell wall biosynthesis
VRGACAYEAIHRAGFGWNRNLPAKVERTYNVTLDQERKAAAVADFLFVVSPGLKDYAVDVLNASEDKLLVVPSCVAELNFDLGARTNIRRTWGVNDVPVFIYSGRLGPERAPGHLLRLFRAILDFNPEARLVVLSYLNELENLGELLRNAHVPESSVRVESHSRDEALRLLSAGDAGVLFLEDALRFNDLALPIKIAEYLSAGLPLIINSNVGRVPELVRARSLGWIVDQDVSEETLRSVAHQILSDLNEKRELLRQNALAACSEDFLWRKHIPAIRQAYAFEHDKPIHRLCPDTEIA